MMESKFTGGLLGLIGTNIVTVLICIFTLFLGFPFAICYQQKWYAKHTIIDGRQMEFTGNGGQLWGKFIVWMLLTIITVGIYSFWLNIKMHQWVVSKTHVAGTQN